MAVFRSQFKRSVDSCINGIKRLEDVDEEEDEVDAEDDIDEVWLVISLRKIDE
jgi:hypothetical protein